MNRNERFTYNEEAEAIEAYEVIPPASGEEPSYQITLDRIRGLRSGENQLETVEGWMNHWRRRRSDSTARQLHRSCRPSDWTQAAQIRAAEAPLAGRVPAVGTLRLSA